jgi:methylglutamate dehydrogenase subunit D
MPEIIPRVSPLAGVAVQGRFGADKGAPGVEFSVRHPMTIVTVIARKGKAKALGEALKGLPGGSVQWAGADQYFVLGISFADTKERLERLAACSDQSHGRVIIRIEGPKARQVLAKGTPVDLHEIVFPVGQCAVTQRAYVGIHISHPDEDAFELSVFRGFSESFWEWLTEQAEEFGYQVK